MAKKASGQAPGIPKFIIYTGRFLELLSHKLAARYASRLFTTPIKHQIPRREHRMDAQSVQHRIRIEAVNKEIVVYHYGESNKKILLVHGWSGRGTQLVKIADALRSFGYSVVSFDAPAHGKARGNTSMMTDFIAAILQLEKQVGPFHAAIGHSLGGMSLLNSVARGLKLNSLVTIGSGDVIQDIINEFTDQMRLSRRTGELMRSIFETNTGESMDDYSSYLAAHQIEIPVLVIHDENDMEVPVSRAFHIHEHLKNGELMITKSLGHKKILGSETVIAKIVDFIQQHEADHHSGRSNSDRLQRTK